MTRSERLRLRFNHVRNVGLVEVVLISSCNYLKSGLGGLNSCYNNWDIGEV